MYSKLSQAAFELSESTNLSTKFELDAGSFLMTSLLARQLHFKFELPLSALHSRAGVVTAWQVGQCVLLQA